MHNEYGDLSNQFKNSLRFPQGRPAQQVPLSPIGLSNSQTIRSSQNVTFEPQRNPNINYNSVNSATAIQQPFNYYQNDNSRPRETFRDYIASNVVQSQPISNYSVGSQSQGVVQKLSIARDSNGQYRSYNYNTTRPDVSPQTQRPMQFKTLASTYERAQPSGGLLPAPAALHSSNQPPSYNIYESAQFINSEQRKLGSMAANDSIVGRRISIDFSKTQTFGGPRESFTGNQQVHLVAKPQLISYPDAQRSRSSNVFYETHTMSNSKPLRNEQLANEAALQKIAQNNSTIRSMSREALPQLNLGGQSALLQQQHFQGQKSNNAAHLNVNAQQNNQNGADSPNDSFFHGINVVSQELNRLQLNPKGLREGQVNAPVKADQFVVRSEQPQPPIGSYYKVEQRDTLNGPLFSNRPSISDHPATDRPSIAAGGIRFPRRSISPGYAVQSERNLEHEGNRSRSKSILKKGAQNSARDQSKRKKSVIINEANNTVETYKKYLKKMYNSMQNIPEPRLPEPPQLQPLAPQTPVGYSTVFTRTISANEYQVNSQRN